MVSTELNLLDHIQMSEDELGQIKQIAYEDAVEKLMQVSEHSINEFELEFGYEFICRVTIKPKR